jgi:hypothetical protein
MQQSPAISLSSTAFDTRPLDLPPASLLDTDFAVSCPLVRRRRPLIQFLSIGRIFAPRFLQTHFAVTPLRLATLHLQQVGAGHPPASCRTCTAYNREGEASNHSLPLLSLFFFLRELRCPPLTLRQSFLFPKLGTYNWKLKTESHLTPSSAQHEIARARSSSVRTHPWPSPVDISQSSVARRTAPKTAACLPNPLPSPKAIPAHPSAPG